LQHPVLPTLILLLTTLVLPLAASADPYAPAATRSKSFTRSRSIGEPGSTRPSALDPIQSVYGAAFPIAAVGVWAQGEGFALTRRQAIYDLEGGAALRIREGIHLTASYRMLGLDLGYDADVEGADGEPGIAAPFIGMAFDF